jgi:hypothetical protein
MYFGQKYHDIDRQARLYHSTWGPTCDIPPLSKDG